MERVNKPAAFLRMKSCLLCSDRWKHLSRSVFRALFLTSKEYVIDPAFQPAILNLFLPLEENMDVCNEPRLNYLDRPPPRLQ